MLSFLVMRRGIRWRASLALPRGAIDIDGTSL